MLSIQNMTTMTVDSSTDEELAARQRLDTFKLGKSISPSISMGVSGAPRSGHRHQRSHSRNASISSSSSLSLSSLASSRSSGLSDLSSFSFGGLSTSALNNNVTSNAGAVTSSTNAPVPPTSKRNSHHRRRSSVSTRHESAEMMGVSLPDLPSSSSDHNINLGDKDSIRRRALWALEGKPDVSFTKVEIPELTTPDVEKMMFDYSSKSTLTGGAPTTFGNSVVANKRDSFKLLSCSGSSKDQLHTLVEEEEEEEDPVNVKDVQDALPSPVSADEDATLSAGEGSAQVTPPPSVPITKSVLGKPRPATLNLRPLSLVPDATAVQGLPTPSLTPSPRAGLRSLSLSPASSVDESPSDTVQTKRGSLSFLNNVRRSSLNTRNASLDSTTSSGDEGKSLRRSSISYKTSGHLVHIAAGLPTPEMTPTFGHRSSLAESNKSGEEEFFLASQQQSYKPLSASEQHFLLKSHNTLVARITDLERALSRRVSMGGYSSGSRPSSVMSDATTFSEPSSFSSVPGEPSDEMLSFIRDLKAERDELKKDVEGWRTRVNDLDRKNAVLAKRVETERWEAWSARSQIGILESEKTALEKKVTALDRSLVGLETEKANTETFNRELRSESEQKTRQMEELEAQLKQLKEELELERSLRQQSIGPIRSSSLDDDLLATPTPQAFESQPKPPSTASVYIGLGLPSDEPGSRPAFSFTVDAKREEDNESCSGDEDPLIGYGDEDDYEGSLEVSSFGSLDEYPARSISQFIKDGPSFSSEQQSGFSGSALADSYPPVPTRPTEPLRDSLSFSWSFARSQAAKKVESETNHQKQQSVDRFFNCLDESDGDESAPASPVSFNYEQSKDMFASGFRFAAEDDAPFFFPPGIGTIMEEPKVDMNLLSTVHEEETEEEDQDYEDDGSLFGEEMGGIRITFTPPDEVEELKEVQQIQLASPAKPASKPPVLPDLNFGYADEGADEDFMFGLPATTPLPPSSPSSLQMVSSQPESSIMFKTSSSSLPQPSPSKVASPSAIPRPKFSLFQSPPVPKAFPLTHNAYGTPPNKCGGTFPSFIPQPAMSPSPTRFAPASKGKSVISPPTFIRPPARPVVQVNKPKGVSRSPNEREPMIACDSPFDHSFQTIANSQSNENSQVTMKSVDLRPAPSSGFVSSDSPPSLASFITTPLSTSIFSSVLSWSWGSRSLSSANSSIPKSGAQKPSYVSRGKQLARLKLKLDQEFSSSGILCHCRECDQDTSVIL